MAEKRSPRTNPFQPGWGKPLVWAGRRRLVEELTEVILPRIRDGVKEAPRLIQDERGMGKTALLEVLREEAVDRGCLVSFTTAVRGEHFTRALARDLGDELSRHSLAARVSQTTQEGLRRLSGIDLGPVRFDTGADRGDVPSVELERCLTDLAVVARDGGTQLVVLIDEVQNIDEPHLAAVFTALQRAAERTIVVQHPAGGTLRLALPIAVWLAGLPGSLARFKKARVTFGERCELVDFGPLDERDIREVLVTFEQRNSAGVVVDADAIDRFVQLVHGYPYAFQLLGKAAWDAGTGPVITAEEIEAGWVETDRTMRERYAARIAGLTEQQVAYLVAAASIDPAARTPTAVCRRFRGDERVPASRCGGMSQRLIDDHQVLRMGAHGRLEFSLPGLGRYLRALDR